MRGLGPIWAVGPQKVKLSCLIIYLVNWSFVQSVTDIRHYLPCYINPLPSRILFLFGIAYVTVCAVCGRPDWGFESRSGHGCLPLVSVVCCQVEVSVSGWSLVQRRPTECDREASKMRMALPTRGLLRHKKKVAILSGLLCIPQCNICSIHCRLELSVVRW